MITTNTAMFGEYGCTQSSTHETKEECLLILPSFPTLATPLVKASNKSFKALQMRTSLKVEPSMGSLREEKRSGADEAEAANFQAAAKVVAAK